GIRDGHVTGVQTCALPISHGGNLGQQRYYAFVYSQRRRRCAWILQNIELLHHAVYLVLQNSLTSSRRQNRIRFRRGLVQVVSFEIGRASCRERVEMSVVAW